MKNRKLEKLKNIIAIILLSAGVLMDIGVVLTGKYCLEVTESFMDYIFSSIVTISTLSFSFIALFTGLLDKNYYGYKLKEIIQFRESPVNFIRYIISSLILAGFATVLLMGNFKINCVNTMVSILFLDIFLVGFTAIEIYILLTNDEMCYRLVVDHYKKKYSQKSISYGYHDDIDRLFCALNECIDSIDTQGKNEVCRMIEELEKAISKEVPEYEQYYNYIIDKLNKCVTNWANSFGYNQMIVDIASLLEYLTDFQYIKIDLYIIPLKQRRFWTDQMLLEQDYLEQIKEIHLLDSFKNGKITNEEVEKILYYYFKCLLLNHICSDTLKTTLIENYIHRLTFFHMGEEEGDLTVDAKGLLNIVKYYVLRNENIEERNMIFGIITRELYYSQNSFCTDDKIFYNVLSIITQAFYYSIMCEQETLSEEFRNKLKGTLRTEVSTQTLSSLKFSSLLERNIEEVMRAIGKRINLVDGLERLFEYFPPFSMTKRVIWTKGFNVTFFLALFVIFSDEIGYYSPYKYFIDWENLDDRSKLSILMKMTQKYDLREIIFEEKFVDECRELGELLEHPYHFTEEQQKSLYNHLREEQEKLKLDRIENVEEIKVEWKDVNEKLLFLMNRDKVFGWSDVPVTDVINIKYSTSPQISRREYYDSNKAAGDLQSAILDAVKKYIRNVSEEVSISFDEYGIDNFIEFLKNNSYDARNYSYTQDLGMLKYRNNKNFMELKQLEDQVDAYNTKHIHEKIYFILDKFRFSAKISKIEKVDLTEEECVEVIENSQCYNGMYNIDGVLMSKEKAVKSVQKIFVRERYSFRIYYSFGRKDIARLKFKYK